MQPLNIARFHRFFGLLTRHASRGFELHAVQHLTRAGRARRDEPALYLTPALARRGFGSLSEEAVLKRLPRGYTPPEHPAARWLRFQSFTVGHPIPDEEVRRPTLARVLEKDFSAMLPLVRWLNGSLGYGAAASR